MDLLSWKLIVETTQAHTELIKTLFCEFAAVLNYSSNAPSYQACSAGPTADRRGCGAERADGGRAGTPLQAGPPT